VKRNWLIYVAIFVGVGMLMSRGGCNPQADKGPPPDAKVVEIKADVPIPGHLSELSFVISAEVADTAAKRDAGLSGRRALRPGAGMLYVFPQPSQPDFYEANTPFALTTAFLRDDGTVLELHTTTANDPGSFSPFEPVRYALQVRAGWFGDRGLTAGTRLILPPEVGVVAGPGAAPRDVSAGTPVPADTPTDVPGDD